MLAASRRNRCRQQVFGSLQSRRQVRGSRHTRAGAICSALVVEACGNKAREPAPFEALGAR